MLDKVLKVKVFTYMYFFMKKMEYRNICFIFHFFRLQLAEKLTQVEHDLETSRLRLKTKDVDVKGHTEASAAAGEG